MSGTRCPKCGTSQEPGARFCGACGTRIEAAPVARVDDLSKTIPQTTAPVFDAPAQVRPAPDAAAAARPATAAAAPVVPPVIESKAPSRSRTPPKSLDVLIGRTLNNRYRVEKKIGEGGFGAVFQGTQVGTGREVALKILHPHNVSDQTVVARFRREAEACSKLHDPHTVTIYDFDETEDGVLYLAMELLRGKSLHQLQRAEGPLDPHRVLRIIDQVAQSLGEAHSLGIVHRDMKPENVVVEERSEDDLVKVLDFGIAKVIASEGKQGPALTAVGQTLGTLEFMSPEQLRGAKLDGRSDLYALGIMAYEMLTGELPFKNAKSPTEIIKFHMQEPPPPPSRLRPDLKIPGHVDAVVLKMVAKAPDDRYADAADLREGVRKALAGGGGLAGKLKGLFVRKRNHPG